MVDEVNLLFPEFTNTFHNIHQPMQLIKASKWTLNQHYLRQTTFSQCE